MDKKHYEGMDRLTAQGRRESNDSDFGLPDKRDFPMPAATHVRPAEACFRYAPDDRKAEPARRILEKAKKSRTMWKAKPHRLGRKDSESRAASRIYSSLPGAHPV